MRWQKSQLSKTLLKKDKALVINVGDHIDEIMVLLALEPEDTSDFVE